MVQFLEAAITAVRDLYSRSPALLRMSTRIRIIQAKEIHYGINLHSMFQTITTSAGILEMIKLLAAYYTSLDGLLNSTSTRMRFLQTLVLLLALLAEVDLEKVKEYVWETFGMKVDRFDLEMLILKVISLVSVNAEVFMKGLESAFDGLIEPEFSGQDHQTYRKFFIQQALVKGYILPIIPSNGGQKGLSWLAASSRDGLVCSKVFNRLQYSPPEQKLTFGGGTCSTSSFNNISPIRFEVRSSEKRILVTLAGTGKTYLVTSSELESLERWQPGTYTLRREGLDGDECSIIIQQEDLTAHLRAAADRLENLRVEFNVQVALARREQTSLSQHSFPEIKKLKSPIIIYKKVAIMESEIIGVTYEMDGREISRGDTRRVIKRELQELERAVHFAEEVANANILGITESDLRGHLDRATESLNDPKAKKAMEISLEFFEISSDLILASIDLDNTKFGEGVWFEYRAWSEAKDHLLHFEGWHDIIRRVRMLGVGIFDVLLASGLGLYALSLKPTEDDSWKNEIRVDDSIVLMGEYLVIVRTASVQQNGSSEPPICSMASSMKIIKSDDSFRRSTRRGANSSTARQVREAYAKLYAHSIFR
jgi:hypothetical protein